MEDKLSLRAFTERDAAFLDRWATDPDAVGEFEWIGPRDAARKRRRWEKDGYISDEHASVAASFPDGTVAGVVSYWPKHHGGPPGGCFEIGIALLPEFRGRGLGATAHRLVVEYLFAYTAANRVEALTDDENAAERKTLERAGFRREGLLRGAYFHRGMWRNLVVYAIVRDDASD